MDDDDEFFDRAEDMPVALRILYLGLSLVCAAAALAVLALIIAAGHRCPAC